MSANNRKIIKDFPRPEKSLINEFENIQTANIGDCLDRDAALYSNIKTINNKNLVGPAFTIDISDGDNLLVYIALDLAKEGDVLVISGGNYKERAILGEIIAKYAEKKNLGGIVLDGCLRDYEVLSNMDFPIFATSISPNGPYKNGPGKINTPISIGGKMVTPGDLIIGDSDGVVVVSPKDMNDILKKVNEISIYEEKLLKNIEENNVLDIRWAYDKLEKENYYFIDYQNY
ncbi:dimethylmenaquinone methyltransferase [Ilyobacter polytropus]|uniref:Regulator of ribonuclease activity homolog n=1 Tax=Ilyobacter polytropus (strain ATCC 51220 / DSM 2926 / LMG 16218 / CuHBu1) TaxID=572544 RepID=E3H6A1_ILYPC|nr:dimethylmenaquinone methyltransferase [Ilyobacter polytropus]ADO81860.1 Dimethylmenaquinone methyltransferase [Ilyobacter polytropus DSM 2926]